MIAIGNIQAFRTALSCHSFWGTLRHGKIRDQVGTSLEFCGKCVHAGYKRMFTTLTFSSWLLASLIMASTKQIPNGPKAQKRNAILESRLRQDDRLALLLIFSFFIFQGKLKLHAVESTFEVALSLEDDFHRFDHCLCVSADRLGIFETFL